MKNLRSFLESQGSHVVEVEEPLSRRYEIAALLQRFDGEIVRVVEEDTGVTVVGGVAGRRERLLEALGASPRELYPRLLEAVRKPQPCQEGDGPVSEVVEKGNLHEIPVLTHFEGDPGPYITSGVLHTMGHDGEHENVSFHRLLVLDGKRMAIRVVPRHLYRILQLAREAGEKTLDAAVTIGHHPVTLLAAALPAPFGVSEFDVANRLLGGGLRLTRCEHVEALAPADAELVLEVQIRLDEVAEEGPFVDLSGTHDIQRMQPVVELVGVMRRSDYVYQALLPSGSEHRLLMGMPREPRIWEYVRNVVPNVRGVNMTMGGMGWLHCVVSFEKFREGDPKNVLMAVFAAHPSLKHAVVVDSDIDPFDMEQVEWAIATRFRGDEDLLVVPHVRVSSLDPAGDQEQELGCKVGIDATKPLYKDAAHFERARIPVSQRVKRILEGLE